MEEIILLKNKLEREKKAREELEQQIEEQTQTLYLLADYNKKIFESIPLYIFITTPEGQIKSINNFTAQTILKDKKLDFNIYDILKLNVSSTESVNKQSIDLNGEMEINSKNIKVSGSCTKIKNSILEEEILFCFKDLTERIQNEGEIKELKEQLIESSYRDGVAETAVAVLHNIGNILTSIIGSSDHVGSLKDIGLANLIFEKIYSEIENEQKNNTLSTFFLNESKRNQLTLVLSKILSSYKQAEKDLYQRFQSIKDKANHIGQVISAQQKYANFTERKKEIVNLKEIVSQCLLIKKEKLDNHKILVDANIDIGHRVYVHKAGLAQVLINLVSNAEESIMERENSDAFYTDKIIKINSYLTESSVYLTFEDNGKGITTEVLEKIFKFGFSTKNRGSGFGLHNCSNYIKSEGGSLNIYSDGINKGAKIVIELKHFIQNQ